LNNVHFLTIHIEHCSITPREINMQTLVSEIVTSFVGDAEALVTGFGRTVLRAVMAPVERIAAASDVAGVLARRRAAKVRRAQARESRRSQGARRGPFRCLGALGQLT
jgi:hypothetical protein